MRILARLRQLFHPRAKTPEEQAKEAELVARRRDFELGKARYRN